MRTPNVSVGASSGTQKFFSVERQASKSWQTIGTSAALSFATTTVFANYISDWDSQKSGQDSDQAELADLQRRLGDQLRCDDCTVKDFRYEAYSALLQCKLERRCALVTYVEGTAACLLCQQRNLAT